MVGGEEVILLDQFIEVLSGPNKHFFHLVDVVFCAYKSIRPDGHSYIFICDPFPAISMLWRKVHCRVTDDAAMDFTAVFD